MGVTSLKRKARKNRVVSKKRIQGIKLITAKPVVKKIDIDQVKGEFENASKKPAPKKVEKPVEEVKAEVVETTEAVKEEKAPAAKKKAAPKAEKKEAAPKKAPAKKTPAKKKKED